MLKGIAYKEQTEQYYNNLSHNLREHHEIKVKKAIFC